MIGLQVAKVPTHRQGGDGDAWVVFVHVGLTFPLTLLPAASNDEVLEVMAKCGIGRVPLLAKFERRRVLRFNERVVRVA